MQRGGGEEEKGKAWVYHPRGFEGEDGGRKDAKLCYWVEVSSFFLRHSVRREMKGGVGKHVMNSPGKLRSSLTGRIPGKKFKRIRRGGGEHGTRIKLGIQPVSRRVRFLHERGSLLNYISTNNRYEASQD